MREFCFFVILMFLIGAIRSAEESKSKQYILGVYVLCDELMTEQIWNSFGRNLMEYFGAFFNAINLIFQQLPNHGVTFKVVSADSALKREDLNNKYRAAGLNSSWSQHINITNGKLAYDQTTMQLSQYFKAAGQPYNNSHVIVLFSGRTLVLQLLAHSKHRKAVHANPKRGRICTANNIVITQDNGLFSGVTFTARRLARLLGANYDYRESLKCLYSSSMLMGDIEKSENQKANYKMSECTLLDLMETLGNKSKQKCLLKEFRPNMPSTNELPADLFKPDKYCARKFDGERNIAECTQEIWDISGYSPAGTCQVRCCYGSVRTWKRNAFSMYNVDALDGYRCDANGVQNGINLIFRKLPGSVKVRFNVVAVESSSELSPLAKAYTARRRGADKYLLGPWPKQISVDDNGKVLDNATSNNLKTYFSKTGAPYNESHIVVFFTALGANYDYLEEPKCLYSSSMLMGDVDKKESYTMSPCTMKDLTESLR
ncbi:uncharacterized protein LOC135400647 [Ornithodoros turicata]|uniref:uncharacterized protein LOC135400647 n=1 Tax=Ornithodoros turicata TaxID=34597 RepID=UPI00313A036D